MMITSLTIAFIVLAGLSMTFVAMRLVEAHATGEQERELARIADHDQRAFARPDDVVDRLTKLPAGRDSLESVEQERITSWIVLRRRAREAEGCGL